MAQTPHGAMKNAAARLGIPFAEYATHVLLGERWCYRCRSWKDRSAFGADRNRRGGVDATCRACRRPRHASGPSRDERTRMRGLGFGWCRRCSRWCGDAHAGLCRWHQNEDERRRYESDPAFRHYRKNAAAMRRRGVGAVPPEGVESLADRYGEACVYCGARAEGIDHMRPVSRGGRTTPRNVVPACASCNSRKKDMPFDDWLDQVLAGGLVRDELVTAVEFAAASFWG